VYHADGEFKASASAEFVSANKLPLVVTLTQETAPSIFDNPIKKQACHVVYSGISFKHTLNIFLFMSPLLGHFALFCNSDFTICCCK
jgi:hypothetical protein